VSQTGVFLSPGFNRQGIGAFRSGRFCAARRPDAAIWRVRSEVRIGRRADRAFKLGLVALDLAQHVEIGAAQPGERARLDAVERLEAPQGRQFLAGDMPVDQLGCALRSGALHDAIGRLLQGLAPFDRGNQAGGLRVATDCAIDLAAGRRAARRHAISIEIDRMGLLNAGQIGGSDRPCFDLLAGQGPIILPLLGGLEPFDQIMVKLRGSCREAVLARILRRARLPLGRARPLRLSPVATVRLEARPADRHSIAPSAWAS